MLSGRGTPLAPCSCIFPSSQPTQFDPERGKLTAVHFSTFRVRSVEVVFLWQED
uniref:Uncharacterized protein n=1 Tax=Arundo donax TaxID=35708 RepID=A0A0A9EG02_ARUDO